MWYTVAVGSTGYYSSQSTIPSGEPAQVQTLLLACLLALAGSDSSVVIIFCKRSDQPRTLAEPHLGTWASLHPPSNKLSSTRRAILKLTRLNFAAAQEPWQTM